MSGEYWVLQKQQWEAIHSAASDCLASLSFVETQHVDGQWEAILPLGVAMDIKAQLQKILAVRPDKG